MEGKYVIHPLHLGTIRRQKINMAYMKEPGAEYDFPIIAWYVTNGFHKLMVDTGGSPADGIHHLPYTKTPEQTLEASLMRLGVYPGEITHVISTHLHWDHVGGNHLFENAAFFVQDEELKYACNPLPIHKGGYDAKQISLTNYRTINGDCNLLPGISILLTPGHSPGSQSVLIDTGGGGYLIAGDFIALYECYESVPLTANGVHTDLIEYYKQLNRIKSMDKRILPGHDFRVFTKKCYP